MTAPDVAEVDALRAEIDRLRCIVNSQKGTPTLRAAQRRARNAEHKAEFLQRKCDLLRGMLAAVKASASPECLASGCLSAAPLEPQR